MTPAELAEENRRLIAEADTPLPEGRRSLLRVVPSFDADVIPLLEKHEREESSRWNGETE